MSFSVASDDALIVVDVQRDFLPGGALAVASGERIFAPLAELMPRFAHVYATRDFHPENHSSYHAHGGPWPRHCVAGSHGAQFDPRLDLSHVHTVVDKGVDPDTDGYSGFVATDLEQSLRALGVQRVFVCGLATDYCVKWTAIHAKEVGFEVVVLEDASAAVNVAPDDEARALAEMRGLGIIIARSTEVVGNACVRG
jgi:nicotinamidase/pyrazinamidase